MEEQFPVVVEAAAESTTGTASSASLPSATDSGEPDAPTKTPAKKHDAAPRDVRRVVKDIHRAETKIFKVNADFFVQLRKTLRTVERESRQRRLSTLSNV
jgi:hypothetical protein